MKISSRPSDTLSHQESMQVLEALIDLELLVSAMSEGDFTHHRDSLTLSIRELVDFVAERT